MANINADSKTGIIPVRPGMLAGSSPGGKPAEGQATNNNDTNTKEKTPMCLVNELARYNKLKHQYTLIDEQGPAHKKTFYVQLVLGEEEYNSVEGSIKRAQHLAAQTALQTTKYKQPPPKEEKELGPYERGGQNPNTITPTVELNALAMKRGEKAEYLPMETQRSPYSCPPNYDYRGVYNQRRYPYPRREPRTVCVSLRVGNREFTGEGFCRQSARHNAAEKALKVLRTLPVPCRDDPVNGDPLDQRSPDDLKSEVSLVHELALRRKMLIAFRVVSEAGPPHQRTFVTECTVGDLRTTADGNSKKLSKKKAAKLMLDEMYQLGPLPEAPARTKPKNNGNKKKNRNLIKMQKAAPDYGQNINPISRLIQIQQAKKEREPTYTLLEEKGLPRRREFVMQVEVGVSACTGVGPNKKLAKRAAAEAMLQLLGYSKPLPLPDKPSLKTARTEQLNDNKKVTFVDEGSSPTAGGVGRQLVPGLIVISDAHRGDVTWTNDMYAVSAMPARTTATIAMELLDKGASPTAESVRADETSALTTESVVSPKQQLLYLADVLGFQVQFTDFPNKSNNKNEYLSLVSLSTDPPQVSHGAGPSTEASHDAAAQTALLQLAKCGLDHVTENKEAKQTQNGLI